VSRFKDIVIIVSQLVSETQIGCE